jgi:hypothetical protein
MDHTHFRPAASPAPSRRATCFPGRQSSAGAVAGLLFVPFLSGVHARRVLKVPIPLANFTQLLQQDLAAIERPDP